MSGVPDSTDPSPESTDRAAADPDAANPDDPDAANPDDREATADRDGDGWLATVEDLSVRNYDVDRSRSVRVTVAGGGVLDERFDLGPGETAAVSNLPAGTHAVTVETDGDRDAATCRVGTAPVESIVVETGNGVVSVSQGF